MEATLCDPSFQGLRQGRPGARRRNEVATLGTVVLFQCRERADIHMRARLRQAPDQWGKMSTMYKCRAG